LGFKFFGVLCIRGEIPGFFVFFFNIKGGGGGGGGGFCNVGIVLAGGAMLGVL